MASNRMDDPMIEIDGGRKSGSGTLLRDALSFAMLRGQELRLTNIRAKRPRPGLRPQHLRAVEACAEICAGQVHGAVVGSQEIRFAPGPAIRGGTFRWNIPTAGSAVMMAHCLLLPALNADKPSRYQITGGLFQDFAPSPFYFREVFLSVFSAMNLSAEMTIFQPGYVPRGGGELTLGIAPGQPASITRLRQGTVTRIRGIALDSLLRGRRVAERMAAAARRELASQGYECDISLRHDTREAPAFKRSSIQPGAALALWAETDTGCILGADMAGARGRTAEWIGTRTARQLISDLSTGATVDRHLADQIIPFAAVAAGTSTYRFPGMTDHMESRLWLADKIMGARSEIRGGRLQIRGVG